MSRWLLSLLVGLTLLLMQVSPSLAQVPISVTSNQVLTGEIILTPEEASLAAQASQSAKSASPSAEIEQKIQEQKDKDITDTSGQTKSILVAYLDDNPPEPLSWNNFLEHAVRYAVKQGVQPNVIVLVILFPLIATLIAASRHIIGLRGFGIYIPAVLSVALVSTGVFEGTIIFLAIILTTFFSKKLIAKTKLPYLPRTGLLIWTISITLLLLLLFIAPLADLVNLMSVNIFPILILILLSENFIDAQARTKPSDAIALVLETIGLAFICGLILKSETLRKFTLLEPELLLVATAMINIIAGKFVGLRISERLRFHSIIEEEE
ncbi:hypothetical protein KKF92_03105 [Patescibacteria group bacterium]|nr:hypothetical protein [Patescibacteria group bacterium]